MSISTSLYVHIPWCVKKCPYCDFNSHNLTTVLPEHEYAECLIEDLTQEISKTGKSEIISIFFGGGTPSLISASAYENLLINFCERIKFAKNLEITLETNPGTMEHDSLQHYLQAGINRISLGVQSFDDANLQRIGRIHRAINSVDLLRELKNLDFRSYNVDLMYGLPEQTINNALNDLRIAIDSGAPHISWYNFTIEPNTYFYKHPPKLPNQDLIWEIQQAGQKLLADANYENYEISAYAQPGHKCQHNLNYWTFGDYIGIGAGAHSKISYLDKGFIERRWKTKMPDNYMNPCKAYLAGSKQVSNQELAFEYMLNQLRLSTTFCSQSFTNRTGLPLNSIIEILESAESLGYMKNSHGQYSVTTYGRNFLDNLTAMFLVEEQKI